MSNFYIKSLDGLRGVAVLLVIIYHFGKKLEFISFDFELGWIGVQLFFVLSGYLITRILVKEKEQQFSFYMKRFYWRRILRIFPIYFLYLFFITALYFVTKEPKDFSFAAPFLFTYTYNYSVLFPEWGITNLYSHLWSLSVEEQFYLFWPLLVFLLSINGLKRLCLGLIILVPVFRFFMATWLAPYGGDDYIGLSIYWFTISHLDAFAVGGIMNIISEKSQVKIVSYRWIIWVVVITAGIVNLLNYNMDLTTYEISSFGYLLPSLENYQHVWSYSILNILFACIIIKSVRKGSNLLQNKVLVFIGKISYGIYLYHFIAILAIKKLTNQPLINEFVTFLLYMVLVLGISYMSYIVIEKRFLNLKNRKFRLKRS